MQQIADFIALNWKGAFEILLLAAVIYYLLLLFRGTRGAAVFTGLAVALIVVVGLTRIFELDVINWILGRVLQFLAIALLVIFQPELRRVLAQFGQKVVGGSRQRGELIDVLVEAARSLAQKRCGALLAVQREIGFRGVAETGVAIDARATPELLTTIFFPNTPLHDGGVILRGDRVVAAACVFPLSQREGLSTELGMRHRAALGLTEETDAVVIVLSEERGEISVAHRGHLVQGLDAESLRAFLSTTLTPGVRRVSWFNELARRVVGSMFEPRAAPGRGEPEEGFAEAGEPLTGPSKETQEAEPQEKRGEARR